jgi:hypothetical protein
MRTDLIRNVILQRLSANFWNLVIFYLGKIQRIYLVSTIINAAAADAAKAINCKTVWVSNIPLGEIMTL